MLLIFIKGFIIGLAIAAPVGPIGVLCIHRSLQQGFKIGAMTGIGAAFADSLYGFIAAFGLTSISTFLIAQQFWIRLVGGLFLLYLGIKFFFTKSSYQQRNKRESSSLHAFITTFFLTVTNPATILSFVAIFAGLGIGTIQTNYLQAWLLVLGVLIGSAMWWLILSAMIAFVLRHRLNILSLRTINRLSGLIMLGFALYALSMR